ncbi:MAG: pyrimidine 5'-nucleotidase [Rhodobacteraceae bacterium]|nr:pyrimidine 5'-nucleotidase [Paracoccaceae bacterium]
MPAAAFSHVTTWVFDLDNTLYPPDCRLFDLIELRMTDYVMQVTGAGRDEADRLRSLWWARHGTTLAGLMREHGADPGPYLAEVHDIPLDRLSPDPGLARAIAALPGRRIVYTNGAAAYARRVVAARGLEGLFDAIYGIEHASYLPKPEEAAFLAIFEQDGLDPRRAAMFEDDSRNLAVPHALGMRTVLVAPEPEDAPHVHHHTGDLAGFLRSLVR